MELRSITPKHHDLQQISIYLPHYVLLAGADTDTRQFVGEVIYGQWVDLDRVLVQFWESHSIRPRVVCTEPTREERAVRSFVGCLFPEITRRGIIDLLIGGALG